MTEQLLKKTALITCIIGFLGLFLITQFFEAETIYVKELPQDETISYKGKITSIRTLEDGSLLSVERVIKENIFVNSFLNESVVGETITVEGMQQGDYFEVKELSLS